MDLTMPEVTFYPTFNCTMQCKLCGMSVPYMRSEERAFSLEEIQKSIDRYFEIVSRVKTVTISGGEPLLFPRLAEVIHYIKKYEDRADKIRMVTNGTILPNQNVLDAMKELGEKFYILRDDYGARISKRGKELDRILTENHIYHTTRKYTEDDSHFGGWVDFGDFTVQKHTDEEAEHLHAVCGSTTCYPVINGKMWACSVSFRRYQLGLEDEKSEYVDLFGDSLDIQEQQNKMQIILQKKRLTACTYCNGLCADSERFIPAEQLTQEELQCVRSGARSYAEVQEMMKSKPVDQTV